MMAHGHAVSGAVAYLAVARLAGLPADGATVAAGVLVTAGAALVPDLDHPSSTLSRSGGAATQAASAAVSFVAGGHRQLTHSLAVIPAVWWVAGWLIARHVTVAAWVAGFLVAAAAPLIVRSLPVGKIAPTAVVGLAPAIWVGHGIATGTIAAGVWFPVAVTLGVTTHLAGDLATVGGIPLLAPLSKRRFALGLFATGGPVETVVTAALAVAGVWLAAPHLAPLVDAVAVGP